MRPSARAQAAQLLQRRVQQPPQPGLQRGGPGLVVAEGRVLVHVEGLAHLQLDGLHARAGSVRLVELADAGKGELRLERYAAEPLARGVVVDGKGIEGPSLDRAVIFQSHALLPWGLGFAAGAMLFVISHEIIPETHRNGHQNKATLGLSIGLAVMLFLDVSLG